MLAYFFLSGLVAWLYLFQDSCQQRTCDATFNDDGFAHVSDFLSGDEFKILQDRYVKPRYPMYLDNTFILGNERRGTLVQEDRQIVHQIKERVERMVGQPLFVDYAFLRYYNGKSANPFEFYHVDSKHYDYDVTQIRSVVNVYDASVDGTFCYKSQCCNPGALVCNKTLPNSLVLIQANHLRHKFEYSGGERLIFVIDFTTSYKRGIYGSVWGSWDFVWDRIQKWLTSF